MLHHNLFCCTLSYIYIYIYKWKEFLENIFYNPNIVYLMTSVVYYCSYVIGQKHIIYGQNTNQLTITLKTTWNRLIACAPHAHEAFFFLV